MHEKIDDTTCPFCSTKNKCMAHVDASCWCNHVSVPKELSALIPDDAKEKACICTTCIHLFKNDPDKFKKKLS